MTDKEKYILARWAYSIGKPFISDAEYQILHDMMLSVYPDWEYVQRSWSSDPCPMDLLIKYDMEDLIRDIRLTDKTESIPSLGSYAEVKAVYKDLSEKCTGSYKHDGWNIQIDYFNHRPIWVQTRGRSSNSIEVNELLKYVPAYIPEGSKIKVVCEATLSNDDFLWAKNYLGNQYQRSAVSTILANPKYYDKLSLHAFDIVSEGKKFDKFPTLTEWGFKVPEWCEFDNFDELLLNLKRMSDKKNYYNYPTDGWVVAGTATKAIRILAWEEEIYKSFIKEDNPYTENFGAYRISVAANIYPIRLVNSTQRVIPLTNYQRVIDMDLRPGSPVAFKLKSHAIADVDADSTKALQKMWQGKYEDYHNQVICNEVAKQDIF